MYKTVLLTPSEISTLNTIIEYYQSRNTNEKVNIHIIKRTLNGYKTHENKESKT